MNKKLTHKISRAALTLLVMLTMTLTASATDFITDVMVAGNKDESSFNTLIQNLQGQGWTDISQDLNQGCGSSSAYIHLLYKKQSSSGNTGTPITGFYIKTGVSSPAASIEHDGRTYYLVPCQGSDSFVSGHGDLNAGCGSGSAYIFLYYTKDALSNNTGVTGITFNTTQSGAVGENGGSTGYDLNTGCGSGSAYIYMHLTTASGANVVTLCSGSGDVQLLNGHILTGTGGANTHVTIADGATVTLSGVNITAITNNTSHQWPGISCLGNATIVLGGNTTNNVKGGYQSSGIYVPEYKTLTLQGSGTLDATGSQYAAGIGSSYGNSCGNITINSGTVNATGGQHGAGIGSGCENSSCGSIFINGGTVAATGGEDAAGIGSGSDRSDCWNIYIFNTVTEVTATKGTDCDNAIGAGNYGSTCRSVTIGGVETGDITLSPFITFPYTVAFNANGGSNSMSSQSFMYNVAQNLFGNFFSRTNYEFVGWATSADGPKVYDDEQSVNNLTATSGATVTLYAKWILIGSIPGELLLHDGDILTGIGGINTHVSIADGATVTFSGVDITGILEDDNHQWPGITCLGDAVIVLAKGTTNSVKGGKDNPGIYVPQNKTLTIRGSGTLNSTGSSSAAGIGGSYGSSCGNITISGGTIIATGGLNGAGIGSGFRYSSCGNITISGGTVTASGGSDAAGIGSGCDSSCGNITISDGTVTANSVSGGAGIGSGRVSTCGYITISGGNVTATGGQFAASIGSGYYYSSCNNITISGGTITATGGDRAAGIGSGYNSSTCGTVTITNGVTRVTATKGAECDNAIGAGKNSTCGTVTIGGIETGFITQSPFVIITKAITGYGTSNGGWHLIASPIAGNANVENVGGLISTTPAHYDLYRFNQGAEQEWENWKQAGDHYHFNIESGCGYLYANQDSTTLTFSGMPYTGNGQIALTKTAGAQLEGWNLVGNPFGTAATLGSRPFYRMNTLGTEIIASETNTVASMEGIFVVAAEDGEMVTFTEATRATDNDEGRIVINVSGPSTGSSTGPSTGSGTNSGTAAVIDRAIVRFGDEGSMLPKFQMRDNSTKVYIPQDGVDYAVVNAERAGEMPVNFKAKENGTYTLSFSSKKVGFNYLHLIDNMTGNDVDLLQTPSYSFEAKTTDYASRFKLVFASSICEDANDDDAFAFISNGNIVVNGEGVLQVIDVTGRIVLSGDAMKCKFDGVNRVSTSGMTAGVYVLRLINGDVVKTQKMVIQ